MSLPFLVAMVVAGISAIVAAVHFTGGTRRVRLGGPEEAVKRFREDFADEPVAAVRLTASGDAAFLELADGRTGLVHSFGDRFLTRIISPADVVTCQRVGDAGVALRIADFTFSGGIYHFADATKAEAVAHRLGAAVQIQHAVKTA